MYRFVNLYLQQHKCENRSRVLIECAASCVTVCRCLWNDGASRTISPMAVVLIFQKLAHQLVTCGKRMHHILCSIFRSCRWNHCHVVICFPTSDILTWLKLYFAWYWSKIVYFLIGWNGNEERCEPDPSRQTLDCRDGFWNLVYAVDLWSSMMAI